MKLKSINIPTEAASRFDLKSIKMDRLGQIILIAGKNGAGKTRFLNLLRELINNYPSGQPLSTYQNEIIICKGNIDSSERNIETCKNKLKLNNLHIEELAQLKNQIRANENNITTYQQRIVAYEIEINKLAYLSFVPEKIDGNTIEFVPKNLILKDSYTLSSREVEQHANIIYSLGTTNIAAGIIAAIELIQKRATNVSVNHGNDLDITEEERKKIITDYEKLKKYIELFLNTELKRNKDGQPVLFGKRIGEAHLSDGQIVLLQFCIALYAQEAKLEDLIIFMDEPENHLHPAALIEVLDRLSPYVPNGQIWIATHSINLLAHYDPSSIWYVEKGEISYAGNVPHKVLQGLLGNDDEIEKLNHFLSLPAQMASNKFAYESLFYPDVKLTGREDHQTTQIHGIIKEKINTGSKLKVLDFGMGKGRLLSAVYENERINGNNVTDWLDFYGYDDDPMHKEACSKIFESVYSDASSRYFNSPNELLTKHDANTFDVIVMCNVFHEIDPKDWVSLFNSPNSIFNLLKDDGYLLIVEDQLLAVGEKAHSKGFLVFDALEFKRLFKITRDDTFYSNDHRGDGRLKAHHIPKQAINRIDKNSRIESIEALHQNAMSAIKSIRKQPASFKNGKLHGFWAQQLANSALSLEELKG